MKEISKHSLLPLTTFCSDQPNLYIVGFMGVGKSVVGKRVAKVLQLNFIDSDCIIEDREGRSIQDIFAYKGEGYFRSLELNFIQEGHQNKGCLVSCGGGMMMCGYMRNLFKKKGVVIVLHASVDTILGRIKNTTHRPLLSKGCLRENIKVLMRNRQKAYTKAGEGINSDGLTIDEVVRQVVKVYRFNERNFLPQSIY